MTMNININEKHKEKLEKAKKKTGLAYSDLIRRLIDNYLDKEIEKYE